MNLKDIGNGLYQLNFLTSEPPTFKATKSTEKNKPWVMFGEKNDYPNYLVKLLNGSAKHNAIVTGKVQYIMGQGLAPTKDNANNVQLKTFLKTFNEFDTLEEFQQKTVTDLETFGGWRWKLVFNRAGKLKYIVHVPFTKVRTNNTGSEFYVCDKWGDDRNFLVKDVETVEAYTGVNKGVKMLAVDIYRPKIASEPNVYPLPDYVGAIPYIDMDREIANFHYNNLKNGFVGSTIITFYNGEPADDEKAKIEKKVNAKFAGTDNAGRSIINFVNPNQKEPTVVHLTPSDYDKMYIELNTQVQQEIFSGHKVTSPELFGIATEGALGDRNATREKYELFKKTYVQNRQKMVVDTWNNCLVLAGITGKVEIIETEPLEFQLSEQVLTQIATRDELREMAGLKPLAQPVQMRSDVDLIAKFAACGVSKDEYQIWKRRAVCFSSQEEAELSELKFKYIPLTEQEKQAAEILRKNPEIAVPDLAKALNVSVDAVNSLLAGMKDKGAIEIGNGTIDVITPPDDKPRTAIVVMYDYALAPGVGGPMVLDTSHEFCKEMAKLNKLYSREDINRISRETGRDVWRERGGWYNKKGSDVATPYCRHIWQQVIAIKR